MNNSASEYPIMVNTLGLDDELDPIDLVRTSTRQLCSRPVQFELEARIKGKDGLYPNHIRIEC
jgi:hypothetical protein